MSNDKYRQKLSVSSDSTTWPLSNTQDSSKIESEPTTKRWTHAELGIPKRFNILNHTIKVFLDPTPDVGKVGDADFSTNVIRIFVSGISRDVILHTYFHEVIHFVLHYAGRPDLTEDEVLVDVVGGLLAQVLASSTTDND